MGFKIIRKAAFKLACILVLTVAVTSSVTIVAMTGDSKKSLTGYLNMSLSNAVHFSEFAYSQPLWDVNHDEIARLNKIVLKNEMIVGVNIFDTGQFVSGSKKQINTSGERGKKAVHIQNLETAYGPDNASGDIKKIAGEILFEGDKIGRFELFYTEEFINDAVRRFNKKLLMAFIANGFLFVFIAFSVLSVINKPVVQLARVARRFIKEKDFVISLKRKNRYDEIGVLVNAFIDMIEHIKAKDRENEVLQNRLEENVSRFKNLFDALQDAIEHEHYSKRIAPQSENDELCISLNLMLDKLEIADNTTKNYGWLKNGQAELSRIIGAEHDTFILSHKAVSFIADYIKAAIGTVFIITQTPDEYCLAASYALEKSQVADKCIKPGQGLAGQVISQKKMMFFDNIPKNYYHIKSALLNDLPKSVIIVPLIYEDKVKGVIELGSLEKFSKIQMEFIESIGENLAAAINFSMKHQQQDQENNSHVLT